MRITVLFAWLCIAWPTALAAGPDGQQLFRVHCVACHREDGAGGIGLPLRKDKFGVLADSYLFKTIRNGRPGRVMPAFERLSDAQVRAIVTYLRDWSDSESFEYPPVTVNGDVAAGGKLFAEHCASCHGEQGQGVGEGTGTTYSRQRQFQVIPPAVANHGFLRSASDGMLRKIIVDEHKGMTAPPIAKLGLNEQDADSIIAYLRSLQQRDADDDGGQSPMPQPTIVYDSPNDYATTVADLKEALSGYNYRTFPDRYLEQGLFPEWEVNKKQTTVRYCNFNRLYDILKVDPRVGVGLPCRITVVQHDDGRVQLIAMNMALISQLFNNDQLRAYARELNKVQLEILEEVTF